MNTIQPFACIRAIVFLLFFCCFTTVIYASSPLVAKKIKFEKVLGYQLYPHVSLEDNTFFVIKDEVTWQHYFMFKKNDLRAPKVVDLDFNEDMVIVVFKKTHEIWKFETEKVTNQNGNLYMAYEARIIGVNAFKTSDFLHIIKVKKGDFKNIRFFENHVPITDISIDEQPENAVLPPVTFIPDFGDQTKEAIKVVDEELDHSSDITEEELITEDSNDQKIDGAASDIIEDQEEILTEDYRETEETIDATPNPVEEVKNRMTEPDLAEDVEDVAIDMKDNSRAAQKTAEAKEDIETLDNKPIEEKEPNEFLKNISDLESEEEEVLNEETLMASEKIKEAAVSKPPKYEKPGINNTGPSVKDKLAQIMGESDAIAEEQKEEIEEETAVYKTRRMPRLDEATNTAMNNLTTSNHQFGFNIYEQLSEIEKGNIVFSPFALSTSLAMTYGGARNTTESQMLKVLQFQQTSKNLHRNYENILDELAPNENSIVFENTGTELMIGNSIWIDEKFEVSDPYSDVVKKHYHGILQNVSFKDKTAISEKLAEWAKVKTAYNILEDDLSMDFKINEADVVLANSLHLMTKWNLPFDKSYTQSTSFKLREDSSLQVNMMHTQGDFGYFENSMVKVVSMPCNDDYTMLLLMPKAYFQLKAVQKTLMRGGYTHWLNSMEDKKVRLSVPKFSFDTQVDMIAPLEKIGMTEAFDKRAADFSGMFTKRNAPVSNVLHPVHIHINESGISTDEVGLAVGSSSENEVEDDNDASVFEANRPFLFIVMDNHRKHLLLMGRVTQPELAD